MLNSVKKGLMVSFISLSALSCANDQLKNSANLIIKEIEKHQKGTTKSLVPTSAELVSAIKQSLIKGSGKAVDNLGKDGGFFKNLSYKIPLPDELLKVSSNLRNFGLGNYVDEFELSLNRAAERAVPAAVDVFKDMITSMSITDALTLIKGDEDAVTQFFKKTQNETMRKKFLPIVSKATEKVGVTSLYAKLQGQASMFGAKLPDANNYVTDYALKAVYTEFAKVEKEIRTDPVARTTEILKKVFGYYTQPKQ